MTATNRPGRPRGHRIASVRRATPRRGAMLVVVVACMAIVMAMLAAMLHGAVQARRQLRLQRDLRQTELLVDAALDRAALRLADDGAYEGETWEIPADQLLGDERGGRIEMGVERNGDAASWRVRIAAEFPAGTIASIRRTRTFTVEH